MTLQHTEAAFHTKDITEQVAGYAPILTLDKLDIKSNGSALISLQVAGEAEPRKKFFVEETVEAASNCVRATIREVYLSIAN